MRVRSLVLASLLTASVSLSAKYVQNLSIHQGWQLLGATDDITDMNVFDGKCVDYVWKYDTTQSAPQWQLYVANSNLQTPSNIASIAFIDRGQGFWVKGNGSCNFSTTTDGNDGGTNQAPSLTLSQENIDVGVGETKIVSFTVSDPDGDEFTTTLENAPDFVTLSGETITIAPTQNDANWDDNVKIKVTDSADNTTEKSLHIHVYVPDTRIEMDYPVSSGTYDSSPVSSTELDLSKTYYDVRFSTHDGLELESYSFANNQVTVKKYNPSSNTFENSDDGLPYSSSDNKVFNLGNGMFEVKYLGTITAAEGNTLVGEDIFSGSDEGYKFAYKNLQDQYEFHGEYEMKHEDGSQTHYSSITEFIDYTKVKSDGHSSWWHCTSGDCHNGGITFSADSNASNGSGTLVEVDQNGVTKTNAGTWEIKTINGETVLVTNITNSKDGSPIFKMDGTTGLLTGWYEPVGTESIFYWLNESAKDHFKSYIDDHFHISAD